MIVPLSEVLGQPGSGRAVGAFTAYDLETACGVLAAAERREAPVILLLSSAAFAASCGEQLLCALDAAARRIHAPVCIQLDHVSDLALIERAGELGVGAVMVDGSRLDLEGNSTLVASAAALLDGPEIEGELGHLAGGEDVAVAARAEGLTDPEQVGEFVAATGISCLAVSIGNVHGTYAEPPRLDWDLLSQLRAATGVHLSLHGASGLSDSDVVRAIDLGITKINVNLELRQAYLRATAEILGAARDGSDMLKLHSHQMAAVEAAAGAKMDVYAGGAA